MLGNERARRDWTNLWSCFLVGRAGAIASEVTIVRNAEDIGLRAWQSALSFFPIKWWPSHCLPHSVIQGVPWVLKSMWGSLGTWPNCPHGLVSEWTATSPHDDTQVMLTLPHCGKTERRLQSLSLRDKILWSRERNRNSVTPFLP